MAITQTRLGSGAAIVFNLEDIFPGALHDASSLPEFVGLTGKEFALAIDADPAAVSRNQVAKNNKGLERVRKLLATLSHAAANRSDVKTPEDVRAKVKGFFKTPNPAFDGKTPAQILKTGKTRKLQAYAEELLGATLA